MRMYIKSAQHTENRWKIVNYDEDSG